MQVKFLSAGIFQYRSDKLPLHYIIALLKP